MASRRGLDGVKAAYENADPVRLEPISSRGTVPTRLGTVTVTCTPRGRLQGLTARGHALIRAEVPMSEVLT